MAESKTLVTRGVLAVLVALALSAVLFVYTENVPIQTEMEARSALLAGKAPSAGVSETTPTATATSAQAFREGLSVTTVTIYATTGKLTVPSENDKAPVVLDTTVTETGVTALVTTVTRTVTVNVTVTVTKTR